MQIESQHKSKIEELAAQVECPWEFRCTTSDFTDVPEVKDPGLPVECLASRGEDCPLGLHFGNAILCRCPVRMYLAKEVGI